MDKKDKDLLIAGETCQINSREILWTSRLELDDDENISDESKAPTVRFKYSYTEKVKGQLSKGSSYLYFIFDKQRSEWEICDFRIAAILGEPSRWLK